MLFSGVNQFFGLRYVCYFFLWSHVWAADSEQPSLSIGYVVAQLLVYPLGRAWEKLPRWNVPLGILSFDLNPGRLTVKEHAFIVIVSSMAMPDMRIDSPCGSNWHCSVSISVQASHMQMDHLWPLSVLSSGIVITAQDSPFCTC